MFGQDSREKQNTISNAEISLIDHLNRSSDGQMQQKLVVLSETNTKLLQKIREISRANTRLNHQIHKKQNKIDELILKAELIVKQKEIISEKVKSMQREMKEKEEKISKQRQQFLKEKKAFENRDHVIKNQFKKMEDKIKILELRVKKYLEKGDKIQYKNNFEVLENLAKKPAKPMNQQQYQAYIKHFQQQQTMKVVEQNNYFKEFIKEIFMRVQNVSNELSGNEINHIYRQEMVELPPEFSNQYLAIIKNCLQKIEQRVKQTKMHTIVLNTTGGNEDSYYLQDTVNKLKKYFENYQNIFFQQRDQVKGLFKILQSNHLKQEENYRILQYLQENRQLQSQSNMILQKIVVRNSQIDKWIETNLKYLDRQSAKIKQFKGFIVNLLYQQQNI